MAKDKKKDIVLNPVFEPLFMDSLDMPRYYNVYGGRGSGKSFAASIAIVQLTYSKYKHKILYLRQSMSSIEASSITDIREAIKEMGVGRDFVELKGKGIITNKRTGSTISFKGVKSNGSQTAKLKSLSGITTLVIEEAEEIGTFKEFSKVDESVRIVGKPLKIILLYNPGSSIGSWIHDEWFINGHPNPARHHDTMYMHSTYLDNLDNLAPSTLQRYRDLETMNPVYYRNTILAEWTLGVDGRIYDGWGQYEEFHEDGDTWYGMDFGYGGNDKTSVVKITYFEEYYFVELMFSQSKLGITQTIQKMRKAGMRFDSLIYADSAMPLLIEEIRKGGFTMVRPARKGNVEAGIKKVQDKSIIMITDGKCQLYDSYMTFRRDEKNKLPHEPDELAALRYGINSRTPLSSVNRNRIPKRNLKPKGFL